MAIPSSFGDPTVIPNLVAEHIVNNSNNIDLKAEYLASAISEVTPETQTMGAALLQITVDDPRWVIQRSGLCDTDPVSGELIQKADVNFPEGTDVWWRLAMVEGMGDPSSPNLTLTFQHRIAVYLMQCYGPLGWPHNRIGSTRAQFIKYLVDKMPSELASDQKGPGGNNFSFICPALNVIQPVASSNIFGTEVVTGANAQAQNAGINKLPGLTAATRVTIKGQKPSPIQLQNINTILGEGQALNAPATAMVAAMYAAMGESSLGGSSPNVFQITGSTAYSSGTDVQASANGFFTGGPSFQGGGAIALAKKGDDAVTIANTVEANYQWITYHKDSYGHEWSGGQAQGLAEAQAIVNAYNGGLSGVTAQPESDVAQLTRGTPDNPDEDTWTCSQRLASEVNWMLFTSPQPHPGQWGNYIYYMDGVTAVAQQPSVYVSLSKDGALWTITDPTTGKVLTGDSDGMLVNPPQYTIDNSAFLYEQTKASKASVGGHGPMRIQKKSRIQRPQTPSQVLFNLIAGVMQFNAGDVFVFHDAGPLNGRWIVEDVTQNTLADLFAQFTLGPPVYAYPEPQAATTLGSLAPTSTGTGDLSGVASVARQALARQQSGHMFHYGEVRPIQYDILTGNPITIDCSGFAIACYKAAGLDDPSHNNYNGSGYTGDMFPHCTQVSKAAAQPGDLCFFGTPGSYSRQDKSVVAASTTHVNVYVGNGQSISMGAEGDPSIGPAEQMGPSGFLGYYRSDVWSTGQKDTTSNYPIPANFTNAKFGKRVELKLGGVFRSVFDG